jgi:cell wall-associated NlpC family hydrolase
LAFLILPSCVSQEAADSPDGELFELPNEDESAPELDIESFIRGRIVQTALACRGAPYKYGGRTMDGFDCSGFIYYVFYEAVGIEMPRSTEGLWKGGAPAAVESLKPGDIVVFTTVRSGASHAGIVTENSAAGVRFVHAASDGPQLGVIVSGLEERYYKTRYMGGRNYFSAGE